VEVHLIDGTYELFRHFYGAPPRQDAAGNEVGGIVGVLRSDLGLLSGGATHVGVATDHVVESFRNGLYSGYKTGEGLDPVLWAQFHPLEDALRAMGIVVWPMADQEADDGLAAAAARAAGDPRVRRIFVCSPDTDLAQCVRGDRVVQLDRRKGVVRNEAGVLETFGVPPTSIPDWLALVGDSADGFPGVPRWGAKSASAVLGRYLRLEAIPGDAADWDVTVRGAAGLAKMFRTHLEDAHLFRRLATLRTDATVFDEVDELRWKGATDAFGATCAQLGAPELEVRAARQTL
jgi:5'-3' exonuclease